MRGRRGEGVLGGVGVVVGAVRAGPIALSTSLSQGRAIGTGALIEDTVCAAGSQLGGHERRRGEVAC
jgi:hypothetical protein